MSARLFSLMMCLLSLGASGQADSVICPTGLQIEDAVYLTYGDFRYNRGIKKEMVVSTLDKSQLDFMNKALSNEIFYYLSDGGQKNARSEEVFGFVQNNTLYLNYNGRFYRVPVFGAISYFVASVVVSNTFYDPRFGYPAGSVNTTELREFVMNFYHGRIEDLTMQKAEELLSRDEALYAEFRKLRRRKQKEDLYRFIRRYNERHPVYFLK
jgi:hypothetical protein